MATGLWKELSRKTTKIMEKNFGLVHTSNVNILSGLKKLLNQNTTQSTLNQDLVSGVVGGDAKSPIVKKLMIGSETLFPRIFVQSVVNITTQKNVNFNWKTQLKFRKVELSPNLHRILDIQVDNVMVNTFVEF